MLKVIQNIGAIIYHLLVLLIIFAFLRSIFFFYHFQINQIDIKEVLQVFLLGAIPDLSSIIYINSFFLLIYFIGIIPNLIKRILFWLVNSLAILILLIDIPYYSYTNQKLSVSFLDVDHGVIANIGSYITSYFLLFLTFLILSAFIWKIYKPFVKRSNLSRIISFIILLPAIIIGARGGLAYKPITPYSANAYVSNEYIDLWNNSLQTIIYSMEHQELEQRPYFNEKALDSIYNPIQQVDTLPFQFKHVVLIVLESFAEEFIYYLNPKRQASITPFLDSLAASSYIFSNAYANGRTSLQGIAAILAGIPNMSEEAFIRSKYNTNKLKGLGMILRMHNINSSFYHGANNGSMNFDIFCQSIGIENYYGRKEYPNREDFDGKWGIFDEPFLQFVASKIKEEKFRSFSTIFTISSHDPYTIPEEHKNRFISDKHPIEKTISYTDYALKRFFKSIQSWSDFDSTAFIITADHASLNFDESYNNPLGKYRIPLLVYTPGKLDTLLIGTPISSVFQQTQIPISILTMLGINGEEICSFGHLPFKKHQHAFRWHQGQLYLTWSPKAAEEYTMIMDQNSNCTLYNSIIDINLKQALGNDHKYFAAMDSMIKAVDQQYRSRMIENRLMP